MNRDRIFVTQAELQRLDAQELWIEVEDGEIVESENDVTFLHLIIIQNLFRLLDSHASANSLGNIFIDGARYILAGTPTDIQRAYKPDLSFLRAGRIPSDFDWSGDFIGAPDLAVEVVSPGQTNKILLPKISRYLQAGTQEAWLIYPWHKSLYQYRFDAEEPFVYKNANAVVISALFPDLEIALQDVFKTENG